MLQRLHTVAHIHNQSYLECNSRSSLEFVDTLFMPHTKGVQKSSTDFTRGSWWC